MRGRILGFDARECSAQNGGDGYAIVAGIQQRGGIVAYIDVSQRFDRSIAQKAGIDVANLVVSQPDSAENALGICLALASSNAVDAIVVDSVSSLVAEEDMFFVPGDDGYQEPPTLDELMRDLAEKVRKSGVSCLFGGIKRDFPRKRRGVYSVASRLVGWFRRRKTTVLRAICSEMDDIFTPDAFSLAKPIHAGAAVPSAA